ncbi:gliding motility-associated ABC transporter substrate-binding protein GldG [Adhaeribacter rhizoryzae]|uniref:Gliding motility-associated ABC transporter substrate-binding protein GldG n=1 Tax=Adhaeribacter rhizoryzae TaxID=2607907 RepID=A0A5M6DHN8_9BACT|nr:gliding motility-associated ABC transporter substrate-binding protein GldG [Adhaeribacter rhizoryzae]KAA5544785.1 gliding motility-associated ABC transporter substrate-binding protein GldG [Adhaeribacter rhizoryzae]
MVEEKTTSASTSRKKKDIYLFIGAVGILLLLNILLANVYFRVDLTEDKRYSIAPVTKQLLANLKEDITVDVYLAGDFPARFKRLQNSVRETLEEFRVYSDDRVQFNFINPSSNTNPEKRNNYYQQLIAKGLQPTNLVSTEGDKTVEKIIFPGGIVSSKGKEVPVIFLKGNQAAPPDEQLNQSIEGLEFELASAIRQLTQTQRKRIGFIEGHGELGMLEAADFITTLQKTYDVFWVDLTKVKDLKALDAVVVAKPLLKYSEAEKFKLDQFIVGGGRALFFIDPVNISLDSIRTEGTVALPLELNLQDLLFNYGVRLNGNLVQDINAGQIPMVVGMLGNQPQTQLMNWRYYPIINGFNKHTITRNLDALYSKFVSNIDSVRAKNIKKTPLIATSPYSRVVQMPASINLNEARVPPKPEEFTAGPQVLGYLLEGQFRSVFANRPLPAGITNVNIQSEGKPSKLVVVADGDLIRNEVNPKTKQPFRLGFDRYSGATYANKDFATNAVDYLLDETNLVSLRAKEIVLRPLDRVKAKEEKQKWQLINLVLPLILLVSFGIGRYYLRKRKYAGS